MAFWLQEPLPELIEEGRFVFRELGPLHGPINSFKIFRTAKLALALETVCDGDAESNIKFPGRGRFVDEERMRAEIESIGGNVARLAGVFPYSWKRHESYLERKSELKEKAHVQAIDMTLLYRGSPAYTIDWLENLDGHFVFPDHVKDEGNATDTRTYGEESDSLVLTDNREQPFHSHGALRLTVGGIVIYLTACDSILAGQIKPGYILYCGTPDEETRRKIRTVLSFALGIYLVHLGHSTYTSDWKLASFQAISAYSLDMNVFGMPTLPPALLGIRGHNLIETSQVARLVDGLYVKYEELDFGNLSWGYWHALCAPLHIKAVHFGAIIEALQRSYIDLYPKEFSTKVITVPMKWKSFAESVSALVGDLDLSDDQKKVLRENVGNLNLVPARTVTEELFKRIGLELGRDEYGAWRRRNAAAHGREMEAGTEREVIRDSYLLRVLFHRMILKIVNGSDRYYDYASQGHPLRNLHVPVPSKSIVE